MGISDTQFNTLEATVKEIGETLSSMNTKLDKISLGIYGDKENNHLGLIEKQIKLENKLETEVKDLKDQINEIKKKNEEQDIAIKAKKNLWVKIIEVAKWVGLAYLVGKGIFGADTLFGKFF
jgi:hypothetical protein